MEENNKLNPSDFVWGEWEDWSKLSGTDWIRGFCYVSEWDFEMYLERIYRDISRNFNVSYKELKTLIENENQEFFNRKKGIFYNDCSWRKYSDDLIALEEILMVPIKRNNNLENCLEIFGKLTEEEKIAFLKEIGKINIEVSFSHPEDVEKK